MSKPFNCNDQAQPSWLDRAQKAAGLVKSAAGRLKHSPRICDIGCGDMKLRPFLLEAVPDLQYAGLDLVPQTGDVLRFDVRRESLPANCDIAVMLGVLEYVPELPDVLARLSRQCSWLVASYVPRNRSNYTQEQLTKLGWAHHITEREFASALRASDFFIEQEVLTANRRTVLWLCRSGTPSVA